MIEKKSGNHLTVSIIVFAIVLGMAMVVNGVLGLSGFEGVYTDALVSRYNIDGEYVKGRIESSLDLGKRLHLMDTTVQPLFAETLSAHSGIEHLYVADAANKILYTTRSSISRSVIPFDCTSAGVDGAPATVRFLDSYFICLPLYTNRTEFTGTLLLEFSERAISTYMDPHIRRTVRTGALMYGVALLLYMLFSFLYVHKEKSERLLSIILLLVSQFGFSFLNLGQYNNALSDEFTVNMQKLARTITGSMEKTVAFMSLDSMSGVNEYLGGRISGNVQSSGIFITDNDMQVLYQSVAQGTPELSEVSLPDPDMTILDFAGTDGAPMKIALRINRPYINGILRDMILDSATVIIVALIFAFILKNFFALKAAARDLLVPKESMDGMQEQTVLRLIQISTFVFMFAAYETLSFIPLYIQEIYRSSGAKLFGLSSTAVESLPISTYMIGIMLAMMVTLFAMRAVSVRRRYIIMSAVFIAGSLLTLTSVNIPMLALARLVCGFGFGGILLSTSSLVIEYTSTRTRGAGFGTNAAAFAAASIASIPVGGVVVNKFGYKAGIWASIVFALLFLLFALTVIPERREACDENTAQKVSLKDFVRIFCSRHIITYILFVNIPFQIIYWGLFQFLLPIYMNDTLKLSQGNIGRILGIFSIVSLFAASISRLADKVKNDKLLIAIGGLAAGLVLVLFGAAHGGFALFIAVMIAMGVDNLFIDSIEELYLESGHVKGISEENLLQSYKVIEKVLSVFIPSVTSLIIVTAGFNVSMLVIGLYSAVGAALFLLFGRNGRWGKKDA